MLKTFLISFFLLSNLTLCRSSQLFAAPRDVIFITDNSTGVTTRSPGDRDWISPSRIQGTYNAAVNFVDSFLQVDDRLAHIRFYGTVDTAFGYTGDWVFSKAKLDSLIDGKKRPLDGSGPRPGHALWKGILAGVMFADANQRVGASVSIVLITTWVDQNSLDSPYPMGSTEREAVDSLKGVIQSIRQTRLNLSVHTISVGEHTNPALLQEVAAAGCGIWDSTNTGTDIDVAFQNIGNLGPCDKSEISTLMLGATEDHIAIYPNPFNPSATISFRGRGQSNIRLYDLNGHLIRRFDTTKGEVVWNGRDLHGREVAPGTYVVRANVGDGVVSRRIVLLR